MSEDACVFSTLQPTIEAARKVQMNCVGKTEKLCHLPVQRQIFGCVHVMDLMLLRGGIVVDWKDEEKCREIFDMSVCAHHKKKLLTEWDWNFFSNKYNGNKQLTCSLAEVSHDGGVRPPSYRRINKTETLKLIETTGRFFHVGTGICYPHQKAFSQQNFDLIVFHHKDQLREESLDDIIQEPDQNDAISEHEWIPPVEDDESIDSQSLFSMSSKAPLVPQIAQNSSDSQKLCALREITGLFGLSRLTSDDGRKIEWKDLQPDTQRKKISSMLHLQNELFKLCAGASWEEMRSACIRKTGQIVDSSRVTKILESIDERLEHTADRRSRLSLISILTGHFTEKEIIHSTGVSRYFIREAKMFALCGLDDLTKFRRVRYDLPNVKTFVSFISRPEIIVSLPKPARSLTLTSGVSLTLASVARLHSYRQVISMYKSFMKARGIEECSATGEDVEEFIRKNSLGYSTCIKIMETVLPVRRVRMQCVDLFQADAIEAFDNALACVAELKEKGKIGDAEAGDLHRRLRVAQNYLTGYFRMHLSMSSKCSTHCIRFALSDPSSSEYQSPCDHEHVDSCEQCSDILSVFAQFKSLLNKLASDAHKSQAVDRFRLSRMIEECDESETKVLEYQRHIVRAAKSELGRVFVVNNLADLWAFITMDFSLKLMPCGFVESQSQWFGKAGISFHVSHVLICKGGKFYHHTLGHLNDDSKQDTLAICVIADHLFKVLSENGVKNVVLRSDNAGNYRNAGVIHTLRVTAAKYGLNLSAYLFSEAQSGKGAADRQISHAKRKLADVVNSGGYGRNADQILKSLSTDPLLKAFSFYTIKGESENRGDCTIQGITNLSSFRFEEEGIRVRKYDMIGDGIVIPYEQMEEVEYKYEILGTGGHQSQSTEFWGDLTDHNLKKKTNDVSASESEDEEDEQKPIFRCPEDSCSMKYLKIRGLEEHLLLGTHKKKEHKDTVVEAAAKIFAKDVETNEGAYLSMKVDSLSSSHSTARCLDLSEGWAVRIKNKKTPIDPIVRRAVRKYFVERRKEGKRAEARWVVTMLRNKTDPIDGAYCFPLKICLKETQAQGLIGRFLKVESSKKGLKALESDEEEETERDAGEDNEEREEIEVSTAPNEDSEKKKRGRPRKNSLTTEKGRPARKITASRSKTFTTKSGKQKRISSDECEGDSLEDEEEEDAEAGPSTAIEVVNRTEDEGTVTRRRGRPRKTDTSDTAKPAKSMPSGRKKKETKGISVAPPSTRVLRSRKRAIAEEKMTYCEVSSDEDVDDYTMMMNAIHKNKEIFTAGE